MESRGVSAGQPQGGLPAPPVLNPLAFGEGSAGRPAPYEPSAAQVLYSPERLSYAYLRRRALAIVAARKKGVTLRKLADRFGVTRERIRSIYVDATRDDYEARCRQRRLRQ
jgi:hypothetical protein